MAEVGGSNAFLTPGICFRLYEEQDYASRPAHTDPEIYARWVGPDSVKTSIDYWDARTGGRVGSWRASMCTRPAGDLPLQVQSALSFLRRPFPSRRTRSRPTSDAS